MTTAPAGYRRGRHRRGRRRFMFIPPDEPLYVTLRIALLLVGMAVGMGLILTVHGDLGVMVFGWTWVIALAWTVLTEGGPR